MSFTPDVASTEDVLGFILFASLPTLPPQEQKVGPTLVSWWETDPGKVYIHADGGSPDDRHYATTLISEQLKAHGYERAQFDLDDIHPSPGRYTSQRTAGWPDIMAKAKRLIQSGQVRVLRNGFNYIVGHVTGDHGDYETEISRDDPNSRSITGWQCSCPWDQYAWQRTRKWKKFEGRPCAHVMGLYWQALSTPMDEQLTPEQAEAMGTGQKVQAPAVADHPPEVQERILKGEKPPKPPDTHEFGLPRSFSPEGDIIQGDQQQMNLPPDALGGPPGPAQAPMAPPPGPQAPGILPPFPGEQMQMQWGGPGTTPGGGKSPPGAYTVPGAKPPSPANPVQNPGTYSAVQEDPLLGHLNQQTGWQWSVRPSDRNYVAAPTPGEQVTFGYLAADPRNLGSKTRGYLHSFQTRPSDPETGAPQGLSKGYGTQIMNALHSYGQPFDLYSEQSGFFDRFPWLQRQENDYINQPYDEEPLPPVYRYTHPGSQDQSKVAADFQAPQVVRLKKDGMGIAEGPEKGRYGDGEYRGVPAGTPGEVRHQDATTGWVEVVFALDDTGAHEPFHVAMYLDPSEIEPTNLTNAFIRRR